jgi:hypothetical protein
VLREEVTKSLTGRDWSVWAAALSCGVLAAIHLLAARNPDRNAMTRFVEGVLFQPALLTLPIPAQRQIRIVGFVFLSITLFIVTFGVIEIWR